MWGLFVGNFKKFPTPLKLFTKNGIGGCKRERFCLVRGFFGNIGVAECADGDGSRKRSGATNPARSPILDL